MTNKIDTIQKEIEEKLEWLRLYLTSPRSTYEGDGEKFVEDLLKLITKIQKQTRKEILKGVKEDFKDVWNSSMLGSEAVIFFENYLKKL